jgi:hypothetical protein
MCRRSAWARGPGRRCARRCSDRARRGEFLAACDASFKQGSRFDGWASGAADDTYLHPFTTRRRSTATHARCRVAARRRAIRPFAAAVDERAAAVCDLHLAPRQRAMPGYQGALNYAYHLDAAKFGAMLAAHGVERLIVRHVRGPCHRGSTRPASWRYRRGHHAQRRARSRATCSSTAPAMRRC